MAKRRKNDLTLVDLTSRNGFYRNAEGQWQPDRRLNADRRADRIVELNIRGMRNTIRRAADHEMWDYISADPASDSPEIRHVRSAS